MRKIVKNYNKVEHENNLLLNKIKKYKILSKEEELEYVLEYVKTKSQSIRELLINSNLRFVLSMCKMDSNVKSDKLSYAIEGFIKGFDDYIDNGVFDHKIISHAVWYIRRELNEYYINNTENCVSYPSNVTLMKSYYKKAVQIIGNDLDIDAIMETYNRIKSPTTKELNYENYFDLIAMLENKNYNNHYLNDDGTETSLIENLGNEDSSDIYSDATKNTTNLDKKYIINDILSVLNEKERYVLTMKLGLNTENNDTYSTDYIASKLNTSTVNVNLIYNKAIGKLKNNKNILNKICELI